MTCGYVCPQCEGSGYTADGEVCDWCKSEPSKPATEATETPVNDETWINQVHEGKCCSD